MFKDIDKKKARFEELQGLVSDPKVLSDPNLYRKYAKELAELTRIINLHRDYEKLVSEIRQMETVLEKRHDHEDDYVELAASELDELRAKKAGLEKHIEEMILDAQDTLKDKNIIVEIRAGTGGLEAGLFAADLFRMYSKYASKKGWKLELLSSNVSEKGGFKEVIFSLAGSRVYDVLRFESGTHRVQRVPETEASGRIHTSAATVAVLPDIDDVEIDIKTEDLKIDTFRAGGRGGQHVNVTDSAVRVTHIPTGLVVSCQDERSQYKNKTKAMRVLRARLFDFFSRQQQDKISKDRKKQVGSGDRSEKIRTYNFPDRRLTDHRIGFTVHNLEAILDGGLDELIAALQEADRKMRLGKK
ncbi:MAG: peptide chain release factor 1 [Candidatus Omnitrophota bacterium]